MSRIEALKYYKIGRNLPQGSKESQYFLNLSIESDSTFSYAYFEKSVPYNKRGDYAEGFKLLNKAVELNPKMHLGYRGWLRLVKIKDYEGCIDDLENLLKIKSKNTFNAWGQNIRYLLGICYLGLGEFVKAINYFNEAIVEKKEEIDLNIYLYKSIALLKLKRHKESIRILSNCISHNKNFVEAYYFLGKNHIELRNKEKSKFYLNIALKLYQLGYKIKNPYNEVFLECYEEDIKSDIFEVGYL
jgi:tetratricopeptide (TPR) repeat protein